MENSLSSNYFELFGLQKSFDLDPGDLAERFRKLQQTVHPDRFASSTDQERRLSMQQATLINEAYQALKDPLSRAQYLLLLEGDVRDDEQSTIQSPGFLMEQMELREALSEARGQTDPLSVVGDILDQVVARIRNMTTELSSCFAGTQADVQAAREIIGKLQFLYKLRSEAEELEADLEDAL
jgi:molecular chaperone HscB